VVVGLLVATGAPVAPEATDVGFRRFGTQSGMVFVPAGAFWMGANDRGPEESPRHRVWLDGFSIDRFEVSQREYDVCVEVGACTRSQAFPNEGHPRQPVVGVTWTDADAYCRWAGKRLPTEAEWEKAARGEDGRMYPWDGGLECARANFGNGHNNECASNPGHTAEVGQYPEDVSPWGVFDMAGNAWEHVADRYDPMYYRSASSRNPQGPVSGKNHVVKGGSWYTTGSNMPLSSRISRAEARNPYDGFRCARSGGR